MKIQSLKATLGSTKAIYHQITLNIEEQQDIEKIKSGVLPAAYIIRDEDISKLCESVKTIINRGKKDPRKALSEYLIGRNKDELRVVDGNFNNAGSLKKGVSAFLRKVKNVKNIYFIGINKETFENLWEESSGHKPVEEYDETQFLKELIGDLKIPAELKEKYVGESREAESVRAFIFIASKNTEPVLILGDTGTGKEVVAQEIHNNSDREGNIVTVNCGAIPKELFESEIFGHEPNSFTGAGDKVKIGAWEAAKNGTLFFDEVGEMLLQHQVKVLRALDNRTIKRIGGTREIPVTARIIAATNRNLSDMVQTGQFREDLYYRLRGFLIRTYSLRDHPQDIPLLAEYFWQKMTKDKSNNLPQNILKKIKEHHWPGNVRELKLTIRQLHALYKFKASALSTKGLNFVFHQEGQCNLSEGTAEKEMEHLRADCWRHLRKVDDTVRAVQHAITVFTKEKINDGKLTNSLNRRLAELDLLCRDRLLFYNEQLYSSVLLLKQRLAIFHGLLKTNILEANKYRRETLDEEFNIVLSAIFRECERLIG
jgi:transcriptional regulator with PAS, ATPase and Fis domain